MKYIRMHEHTTLGAGKTTLVYPDTYKPVFKGGGTLTVTSEGYRLATQADEVVEQGTETDVLTIVKALDFSVDPLLVKDEIRGVELPYAEYDKRYNHGNHFRDKSRRFFVNYEKDEQAGVTTFGIVEKAEGLTYAIHSIYMPEIMNRKERSQYVVDYIASLLYANEFANVQGVGIDKKHVSNWLNKEHVRVRGSISSQVSEEETAELAADAMKRKATVIETFKEPIKFERMNEEDAEANQ